MNREQVWKNFDLGTELSISGVFIYNGLRRFHEMRTLDRSDLVFEFLYNLSVGLERLLKVTVVLLEHDGSLSHEEFENSLITHSHPDLLARVRQHVTLELSNAHNRLLALVATFYKSHRYDRFTLSSHWDPDKEVAALRAFLEQSLDIDLGSESAGFPIRNTERLRKHIEDLIVHISRVLFRTVSTRARELNLYTYELPSGSKAQRVFLGAPTVIVPEDVLWKELLVFFMNTKADSAQLSFLRSITPLDFDQGRATEYLECLHIDEAKGDVLGELQTLYADLDDPGERLKEMDLIGNPDVCFDDEDAGDDDGFL